MLEDLVVAGVNKALDLATGAQKMQEAYKGMIPGGGIPGMDLSKFDYNTECNLLPNI